MPTDESLNIYEQVLLLALRDEQGTIHGTWYRQAVAGAILADLLLRDHIALGDDHETVILGQAGPPPSPGEPTYGDPLLHEAFVQVRSSTKPRSVKAWLSKISSWSGLEHRAAEELCLKGVLREDRDKVLLFFDRRIYPELDHAPEQELLDRLYDLITSDEPRIPDPQTLVVLSLAYHTELLQLAFGKQLIKSRGDHIKALTEGDPLASAAQSIIQSLQAAVLIAAILPAITS